MVEDTTLIKGVVQAPRAFWILLLQGFGIILLCVPTLCTVAILISWSNMTVKDSLFLFAAMSPYLIAAFLSLYFPQKYIVRVEIDKSQGLVKKLRKGRILEEYDLAAIEVLVSKHINSIANFQYKLILQNIDGSENTLVNEDMTYGIAYGRSHWERFAEELSRLSGKLLQKEIWAEDYNGKLSLVSPKNMSARRRYSFLSFLTPLVLSFLGAIAFRTMPNLKTFLFYGIASVSINTCFSFIYSLRHRQMFGKWAESWLVLIICVLTLVIPYSMIYAMFAFLLSGFKLPFGW